MTEKSLIQRHEETELYNTRDFEEKKNKIKTLDRDDFQADWNTQVENCARHIISILHCLIFLHGNRTFLSQRLAKIEWEQPLFMSNIYCL